MTRIVLKRETAWVDGLEDRVVAIDLERLDAPPRVMPGSGAAIWRAIAAGASTEDEIVSAVAEAYAVETTAIEADVHAFLRELLDLDLIRTLG